MPIPDYQSIMLPLLKFAGDKKEHSIREAIEHIANIFNLSEEERREVLPSGQQYIIDNRVGWARTFLKKAGLLESTKRSYFKITDLGLLERWPRGLRQRFAK
jgi:restriction system protein